MLDDFSREVLAVEVNTKLPVPRVIRVLDLIAAWRGYPAKMRMETARSLSRCSLPDGQHNTVLNSTIHPTRQAHAKLPGGAFQPTFRDEILNFYVFSRLSEVRHIVDTWLQEYNEQSPHESLGNLTPEEFALKHAKDSSLALH